MTKTANFQVDPKLAELLGETYKSTEDATKELVDNAYDADSDNVWITLPDPLTPNGVITIVDDGTGMKEQEVRSEYLKIASSRLSRKGEKTFGKKRMVKGRKGIGKFSGLMIAEIMEIKTKAGGKETTITIIKQDLAKEKYDLEKVSLPIVVTDCPQNEHGTTITLKGLNQNYNFPNADRLRQLLILDYRQVADLSIYVNGEKIGVQDYQGATNDKVLKLSNGRSARLIFTVTEKAVKEPGLVYRVGNKIVGRPNSFLKEDEQIPDKLKKRIVGEIICDELEDFVTADWGAIVENSTLKDEIEVLVKAELVDALNVVFKADMHLARLRYDQRIARELEKLPEHKRAFAEKHLQRVLEKFYDEPEEKVNTIISVMIDAVEKDHYWSVIHNIEQTRDGDVEKLALALSDFGFLEMSLITSQAIHRLRFLDELDLLNRNPKTLESTMHKALEFNLWVLGTEYSLTFSNKTLALAVEDLVGKRFKGDRAKKRPDLFLGVDVSRSHTLIEFKRPSDTIGRDAESQALKYRDDLNSIIHNKKIRILVIGGRVDTAISSHNEREDVKLLTYTDIISNARAQLDWLLAELKRDLKLG
ncbi:ATP-binding protein [Flaviaesturariibacter amylovorans]|uniref:ATP-binding protein n=1 Tax=Flaviaesturariibacter amylovorans TaxID=1084520 RepID=A0ABP8HNK8_9BACT